MVSNKRYEEQADFYDKRIESLERDINYWRDKYFNTVTDHARRASEADVYKSILVKQGVLGEQSTYTDETFMFEGKIYKPISYHLDLEPDRGVALTVDFVSVGGGNNLC